VRVTLTQAGRDLVASDPGAALFDATGLGDDFAAVQQTVVTLRDNIMRATQKNDPEKT
jgi:hypothetical protein